MVQCCSELILNLMGEQDTTFTHNTACTVITIKTMTASLKKKKRIIIKKDTVNLPFKKKGPFFFKPSNVVKNTLHNTIHKAFM